MNRTAEREQFLADIITTAIEGGTGYWAVVHRYKWQTTQGGELPPAGVHAVIMEDDDEHAEALTAAAHEWQGRDDGQKPTIWDLMPSELDGKPLLYKLDIDTIAKGIAEIKREIHSCRDDIREAILRGDRENDGGEIDADGADCIVQIALFGELVYG